jgi:hypothetical protein
MSCEKDVDKTLRFFKVLNLRKIQMDQRPEGIIDGKSK